jgi:Fur family ferric uptake transcriptional regulator
MLAALAEAGYSNTRARRAVVHALCDTPFGATPAFLLARGRALHPRLGHVTVYRTLEILGKLGRVRKLHEDDGCSAYAASTGGHGHHVICRSCGAAVEFEGCTVERVLSGVGKDTGYAVEGHWLELFGTCPACRMKK